MEFQREQLVVIANISSYTTICLEESSFSSSSSSNYSFEEIKEESEYSSIHSKPNQTSNNDSAFYTTCLQSNNSYNDFVNLFESKSNALYCCIDEEL